MIVDETAGPLLIAATIGQVRVGIPNTDGLLVDVEATNAGVELTTNQRFPFDETSPNLALWWAAGEARMQVALSLSTLGADLRATLSWPPQRIQDRQHRRVRLEVPLWVLLLDKKTAFEATTVNLSVGGLAFTVDDWITASKVRVGADIVVVPQLRDGPVGAAGRVLRDIGPRAYSVEFTALGASEESRIMTALRSAEPKFIR